jgi:hypothetical protein
MVAPFTVAPVYHVPIKAPDNVYSCVPFDNVIKDQVTGPEKLPLKIIVFGMPFAPFPVITNDPPAANVPPIVRLPLNEPVDRVTVPRLPVTRPIPFKPFTAIRIEPLRLNPALLPLRVPPLFVKSTELAKPDTDNARVSNSSQYMRFTSSS